MSKDPLPRSAPEAQGVPSAAILSFVDAAEAQIDALHSFVLVRHRHVVAQGWWDPYQADRAHMLFSLSKSFTSTAVGLAVAEGRLSVDDPVLAFFPDAAPDVVSEQLAAMRVRHLLTMTTGHATETDRLDDRPDGDWTRAVLDQPVEYEPGTHFVYNSGASYLLSAIVQRLTGATLLDYLRPRLLAPLGITDATWASCPRGINAGGWGLSLRTTDIARFGELYLREGVWDRRQLLPREWIRAATAWQVSNAGNDAMDWRQGYGYQFWRCRHDAYRADGAFGQFCLVMPEQDAVLAVTGGVPDMQAVLDLVWTHLLPAMQAAPLPADDPARQRLDERLADLRLPPVPGQPAPPAAARVSGRTYRVMNPPPPVTRRSPNVLPAPRIEAITLTAGTDAWIVSVRDEHGTHELVCGNGEWRVGTTAMGYNRPTPVAASGAWVDNDTYVMRLCLPETPFIRTFTCRFHGADLTVTVHDNVSFGPTDHPPALARA